MVDMLSQQLLSSALQQQLLHPPVTPGRSGNHLYTAAPFQVGGTFGTFLIIPGLASRHVAGTASPGHYHASRALELCSDTFSGCFYTSTPCQASKRLLLALTAAVQQSYCPVSCSVSAMSPALSNHWWHHMPATQVLSWYPRVVLFPNFLSASQCQHFISLASDKLQPSELGVADVPFHPGSARTDGQQVSLQTEPQA